MMNYINEWKKNLNWSVVPVFDSIHDLDDERFLACYYIPETVNEYIDKIVKSLSDGYGFNHKTIIGDPGCGKTTFIYYLRMAIKNQNLDASLHMEILHIQRLISYDNYESVITERVLKIFSNYFSSNSLQSEYETLTKDPRDDKISINKLKDFILEKKGLFTKRLIIVIDDIDETSEEIVEKCLRFIYSLIECERISRWLMARSLTLENYKASFGQFIETKFQQKSEFPKVDLYGIIEKRIKSDNPDGLNPFIPELCHQIIAAHNNDLRVSVSNSHIFLEDLKPPANSENNAKFSGQYFMKNFTKMMTKIQVFPNIYKRSLSDKVPIEKDVFLILAINNRFESGYLSALEGHYKNIYSNIYSQIYLEVSYLVNINMDHINESIHYLVSNRLIYLHPRIADFYKLTTKGESFIRFLREPLFTKMAKESPKGQSDRKHPVFWDLAEMFPEYNPVTTQQHRR